jgi:hypothetical protein
MDNTKSSRGYSGALILIALGIILLLNNLNIVAWDVWDELWPWWPLVVIFTGFDMLSGENQTLRKAFFFLEIFILVAIILAILFPTGIPYLPLLLPKTV